MRCKLFGHRLKNTLIITEKDGFYEVFDAKYCKACGLVKKGFSENKSMAK
ncbi:MAG: hypothetical protein QXG01_03855 [Candidatus Bathyarchaeia archaeon]